jgi:hypothetical protein
VTSVEDYQTRTEALAGASAARVLAVYAAYQAGQLAADQAAELISGVVNLANAGAVSLADMFIAAQIEELAGVPTPVTGAAPTDEHERLLEAVHTILSEQPADPDEPGQAQTRLERLARSEPLETAQRAATEAMQEQPLVQGWTRAMDSDPCPLCVYWWREGRIWPKIHPFQGHKGCNCAARVVLAEHIESTVYTRQLERNRA